MYLILLQLLVATPGDCSGWNTARQQYFGGEVEKCFEILEACDLNPEALRFYSDALWWEGRVEKSLQVSEKLARLAPQDREIQFHVAKRKLRWSLGIEGGAVFSENGSYAEFGSSLQVRYYERNSLRLSYLRQARALASGRKLSDHQLGLEHSWIASRSWYLETSVFGSPDDEFLPRLDFRFDPHFVYDRFDFHLGARYSYYRLVKDAVSLKPSVSIDLSDRLRVSVGSDLMIRPKFTASGSADLNYFWRYDFSTGVLAGLGKSYEGDGIQDPFWTLGLRCVYSILPRMKIRVSSERYKSDLRDEYRVSGGLEVLGL
jgi:hypothetical protein